MCPGGAWKAGPATGGFTHFREKCHRRPFGRKCVAGRKEECALKGPGSLFRGRTALRTSREGCNSVVQVAGRVEVRWEGYIGQRNNGAKRLVQCRMGCPQGPTRVHFGRFLFAQVPPRAARSTFGAIIVRLDAPKGRQEYTLGGFCSLRRPKCRSDESACTCKEERREVGKERSAHELPAKTGSSQLWSSRVTEGEGETGVGAEAEAGAGVEAGGGGGLGGSGIFCIFANQRSTQG